jgi:glycosyltransferase involved in cell wall biosynthesis
MALLHLVVPDSSDDPQRPSGGNVYDRRLRDGLLASGQHVREHPVGAPAQLEAVLAALPDGDTVLLDGLLGSADAEAARAATAGLRLFVLLHSPFRTPGEEALLRSAAGVIATSHWSRQWLLDEYALDPTRTSAAPPGVEPAPLAPGSTDGTRLLCVAPLTTTKGYDDLLAALVATVDLTWTCTCVGSLDKDPACAARVLAQVAEHGLADRVRVTGPLAGEGLEQAYCDADLLVLASHSETFGMVVTEALAHGVPVLGTDVGGLPEALGTTHQGDPGMLVRPARPDLLADALRCWLTDRRLRESLRSRAVERRTTLPRWPDTVAAVEAVVLR